MSLLTTSAASIHQLGAAAAFAISEQEIVTNGDGQHVIKNWWSSREAIANSVMSGGWVIEQHTIRKNPNLDPVTNDAVRTKDVCVAGAMIINLANIIVSQMAKHEFPNGVAVSSAGELAPDAPRSAQKYQRYFRLMRLANRAFVAGAIGFTPFVNFEILKSYRPGTFYRLFT